MHEQKSSYTGYFKIFGIKVFEFIKNTTELYEREVISADDELPLLNEFSTSVYKIFGIPIMKFGVDYSPNNENETVNKPKFKINLTTKKIVITVVAILLLLITFACGIFTANSEWFKNKLSAETEQTDTSNTNLEIKSLEPYNTALFKKAHSQYEMNIASGERYAHYHEYYEKVTQRIRNFDYQNDTVKTAIISYLDGYEKRKAELDYVMFPCQNESPIECGYGTMFGSAHPNAMLEFDRQELLTYRMILTYMYAYIPIEDINDFFEE